MTLAPPDASPSPTAATPGTPVVTAVLVVHDGAPWLGECLDALAAQRRLPDRLVVVDTGSRDDSAAILSSHKRIHDAVAEIRVITTGREVPFGQAVSRAVADLPEVASPADWLWLLHDDSAAAPGTLATLLDTARRSTSVGIAGPKLLDWKDPGRLVEVGQLVTRSGRRADGTSRGEADQGQHDHRSDVMAVNTSGMLVRRDVYDLTGGFDPAFGLLRDDLDLCWRAHLAGHRVVVVPRATMRDAAASVHGLRSEHLDARAARRLDRRHGRQVALARCAVPLLPFLALWITLTSLASGVALLLVKRPRRALLELADVGALLTPWRVLGARWRARGRRELRRRDLHGLFVPTSTALRHTLDAVHDAIAFEGRTAPVETSPDTVESGPVSDEAEDLTVLGPTWPQRLARHPGVLAVLLTTAVTLLGWRDLLHHGALSPTGGVTGGELLPVSADASSLWHLWLDGWHGPGLGTSGDVAPWVPVLAGTTWLLSLVPWVGDAASPAALSLTWLLLLAAPLAAGTAYLSSRVVSPARWPRAWLALAWATLPSMTFAVGQGRLGAVAAHVLLPVVAAGIACVARRSASASVTAGTGLAMAVLAAFNPALGVVAVLAAAVLLLVGPGARRRLRALALLTVTTGLTGPWLLAVVADPRVLLTGPGLAVGPHAAVPAWQVALLQPWPAQVPALTVCAPLVLAGLAGLLRRQRVSWAMSLLGMLGLAGLAGALLAPHVVVGRSASGSALTPWPGTGLDLLALALLTAAVLGLDGLGTRLARHGFGWRQVLAAPTIALALLGVLATGALLVVQQVPGPLQVAGLRLPAVAVDQAHSALANRLLFLAPEEGAVSYRLLGSEASVPARDAGSAPGGGPATLGRDVEAVLATTTPATAEEPHQRLADLAVGFVAFRGSANSPVVRRLDSTAGLTRLGDSEGMVLWRVLPAAGAMADTNVPPARARLEDGTGRLLDSVDVSGDHGATTATLAPAGTGRRLVLAEPRAWTRHATVTVDGRRLVAVAGAPQPTYDLPATARHLRVEVEPAHHWWTRGQLGLLALVVFLAVPLGNRRSRRAS